MRVLLRPATMEDVEFITDIKMDKNLWEYEPIEDIPTDREATRPEMIKRIGSDWYKEYLIVLDDGQQTPVGELHLHWYIKERGSWEIGYCILLRYRGEGYCVSASKLALREAFTRYGAHKVVGMCNAHNAASVHVMEKGGMKKEGVFSEELPWKQMWADQCFYSILEHEFQG